MDWFAEITPSYQTQEVPNHLIAHLWYFEAHKQFSRRYIGDVCIKNVQQSDIIHVISTNQQKDTVQ